VSITKTTCKFIIVWLILNAQYTHAFQIAPYSWPMPNATFYVDIPGYENNWNIAFESAMSSWQSAGFTFKIVRDAYSDPCGGSGNRNNKNGVGFSADYCGVSFGSTTLAITTIWFSTFQIEETDIVFNSNQDWDVYSGPYQSYANDFQRVALHELGHSIGLDHEDSLPSIMGSFISDIETLQYDDYRAVSILYGLDDSDTDSDEVANVVDNCPSINNPDQLDTDNDGYGNACDITKRFRSVAGYDGWILESSETSKKGGQINSKNTSFILGDNAKNQQYRSILHFDTASIPNNAVITKATVTLTTQSFKGNIKPLGDLVVDIKQKNFGSSASLAKNDFEATASKTSVGIFKANSSTYTATLNSTGRRTISKTAATQFKIRFSKDDDNDKSEDYLKFYSGNFSVINSRPSLTVEYYLP
jgi:hypothetical protein